MSAPLSLLESADLLGRYRYVELGAFAALGARARTAAPRFAAFLAGASRAHAYRAALFEARLPVSVGLPGPEELTRSPHLAIDEVLDALSAEPDDQLVLDALSGVLYPAMAASYAERLAAASPAADGGLARALRRAIADLDAVASEVLLLASSSPLAARVAVALAAAGGPFGPLRATR